MSRSRVRSQSSQKLLKSQTQLVEEIYIPPFDELIVNVKSLKLTSADRRKYVIKVTFMDQLLIDTSIRPIGAREDHGNVTVARGTMTYDPSDYEKMSSIGDYPLVVRVHPVRYDGSKHDTSPERPSKLTISTVNMSNIFSSTTMHVKEVSCCNVDILPLFKDVNELRVEKRLQPLVPPKALQLTSWDNLPLITMELEVVRNPLNEHHQKLIKDANFMKITLIAAYNIIAPYDDTMVYTAATRTPLNNDNSSWETLRKEDDGFTEGDDKVSFRIHDLQNDDNIDIEPYLVHVRREFCVVWGSFHRSLMVTSDDRRLGKFLRRHCWPLEFHIYGETGGYSFMAFLDLTRLLYPGETTVKMAVPLEWVNASRMVDKCGCDLLLIPNIKPPMTPTEVMPKSKATDTPTSTSTLGGPRATGADESCAFIIVEVQLDRPLSEPSIPPVITPTEIKKMLSAMEGRYSKPICTGRGQLAKDWHATVQSAANSLRRVPYYGMTEFCAFNRQLSETRTRVEITTSFWLEAALYVNNNFVVQEYLEHTFEELLMLSHVCLMQEAAKALVGTEVVDIDPTLRAARHARQLQETPHAVDLYMQVVTQNYNNPNSWRELATCFKDVDLDMANVCINRAVALDPRNPLTYSSLNESGISFKNLGNINSAVQAPCTLLYRGNEKAGVLISKGCMLLEKDPYSADLFFTALLSLYPFWTTGWVIAKAFYIERQEFYMADQISVLLRKTLSEGLTENLASQRSWEKELGDWWDQTPLLPGTSRYLDAADLLLRLRAMTLAEVCLGRALSETGESAACAHLVALSCHMRGDTETALCHVRAALETFGEVSYLRSLEAECYLKQKNREAALNSFEKSGNYSGPYSTLSAVPCRDPLRTRFVLVDLLRRQPSAPAWMALADDWLMRQATKEGAGDAPAEVTLWTCAAACAAQALKWDRRCARAWALLARLLQPRARRLFCQDMANTCGYEWSDEELKQLAETQDSACYWLSKKLEACHCDLCEPIKY